MQRKFLATILFIIGFALTSYAQKVEVEQSFVDDATKAFSEVVALRDEVKTLKEKLDEKDKFYSGELAKKDVTISDLLVKFTRAETQASEREKTIIKLETRLDYYQSKSRKKCIGICIQSGN